MTTSGPNVEFEDDGAIVVVEGEVDAANVDDVRRAIMRAAGGADLVVVDLTAATYMDSSMIGLLLTVAKELRAQRGALRVVAPETGRCRRVLVLSGVEDLFSLHESVADAFAGAPTDS
jgi:anti-sigma B factor antagonist